MSEKVKSRKLNMPMLEMIITLGILIVISVFIMRLFLGANSLETKARDISKACILAQSVGETIKSAESLEEAIKELDLIRIEDNGEAKVVQSYYDSNWKECKEPKTYTMTIAITETPYGSSKLLVADITVTKEKAYAVIKEDSDPLACIRCESYKDSSSAVQVQ